MDASSHLEEKYYEITDFVHMLIKGPLFLYCCVSNLGWLYGILVY